MSKSLVFLFVIGGGIIGVCVSAFVAGEEGLDGLSLIGSGIGAVVGYVVASRVSIKKV